MNDGGIESIGEAVTGAAAARAAEPGAGEGSGAPGADGHGACLNCRTPLVGPHCHQCGQKGHVHRTIGAFWHDIAHGVLHFEGKIWRTLPLLAWHPGRLTRRYVEGERARFVSPLALFLFTVFLMFAVLTALGSPFGSGAANPIAQAQSEVDAERPRLRRQLAELQAAREKAVAAGGDVAAIDKRIEDAREELGAINLVRGDPVEKDGGKLQAKNFSRGSFGWFEAAYRKAAENPKLLFYKLQTNAYKFSWALIPISVPFLWLLFLHRRRYRQQYGGYDHVVFVTYSIAFMSIGLILFLLLQAMGLGGGLLTALALAVPPVHIYRQLRGAYSLGRVSALWRTAALLFFAGQALSMFILLLLFLGVAG